METVKKFIVKIQNSSEGVKKFWLVVLSGLLGLVVVMIWAKQLQGSLGFETRQTPTQESGFWANAFEVIQRRTANAFDYFKGKINTPTIVTIQKNGTGFVSQNLDKIPKTEFPKINKK